MQVTRRQFTGGALSAAFTAPLGCAALAQGSAGLSRALDAIRTYGAGHSSFFGLPGLTLGIVAPGGFATVLDFGYANADPRRPITPDTLFQVGSITKVMVAALVHQLTAERRLSLGDRVSAILPDVPLPSGNAITVQHLLDHVAGLPDSAPTFPEGGLWTAYAPGRHWHYSNTGYDILGRVAARVGGKPLAQLLAERLFAPLGMRRSRGAITGRDRLLYAQGYEPADLAAPFARGAPLAPAAWIDEVSGAGSVGSTADDMNRFLRTLADAAQGRGGLGLSPRDAQALTAHALPSDTPGMTYGNGLMHVANAGRSYLHHTGGMVSFSSSFHVDRASGVGAFASSTVSAFVEYRPRLLTRYAVDAVTDALAGRPVPPPPSMETPLANPAAYVGRYSGPAGAFEVRAGSPLTIVAHGRSAALQYWGNELFRTLHPRFSAFTLKFERGGPAVAGASWGGESYLKSGAAGQPPGSSRELARLAGRYVSESPWWPPATVVERGGKLWIGTETPMTRIGDNLWRVGAESWSPERASFASFVDGRPQVFIFSGVKFLRHEL